MGVDMAGEPGSGGGRALADPAGRAPEEDWQRAEQRALLYLRSLHLHSRRSLELALKALRSAENGSAGHPVVNTISSLRALLQEEGILPDSPGAGLLANGRTVVGVQVAPPIHRGNMVPTALDRRPWLTHLERFVRGIRAMGRRLFSRKKPSARSAGEPGAGPDQPKGSA